MLQVSKKLYPNVFLPAVGLSRVFSRFTFKPKIVNWRLGDQTTAAAEELLNTDGETLLNTDGESLFNTGS